MVERAEGPNEGIHQDETDVPAAQSEAREQAWFPRPYGDQAWPRCTEAPSRQGPQAFDRFRCTVLGKRFTRLNSFADARPFSVCSVKGEGYAGEASPFFLPSSQRRFGMIVPLRPFGNAVKRNYGRRRLREFFRQNKALFPDNHDLLIRLFQQPDDWDRFLNHVESLLERARRLAEEGPAQGAAQGTAPQARTTMRNKADRGQRS